MKHKPGTPAEKNLSGSRKTIALAGNPNVGKSTVFNCLTGMRQHTGNWTGKTVESAAGQYIYNGVEYTVVDLPGTYSLISRSRDEEVARDFICFENPDVTVLVCDAVCLERNLNLVLQTLEITPNAVLCVNLVDEAEKKHITVDFKKLEHILGIPVIPASARSKKGIDELVAEIERLSVHKNSGAFLVSYDNEIEAAIKSVSEKITAENISKRWLALRLLENDTKTAEKLKTAYNNEISGEVIEYAKELAASIPDLSDKIVGTVIAAAEKTAEQTVTSNNRYFRSDRTADRILTSRIFGIPIMLLTLFGILWISITGANYPSAILSGILFSFEKHLENFFVFLHVPPFIYDPAVHGIYRVLAWVVSVMLPPMAIFFPLFTLLEDLGYLPRVAFNLDKYFKKACTCGKQCLTMCMGLGCNAAGVTGCRIIDSPRERLIAIITNSFVPCNGRFPTLIAIISMFFISGSGICGSILSALMLTAVIVLGILMTFFVSWLLSKTLLKGVPSSFALELPPYRRPQIGQVIIRSVTDRTLFVLGRAVSVAAPAGLVIWLMANIHINGLTLLAHTAAFLDPFACAIGLDGVILLAFILGFPANEIVIPIIIMAYMANGTLVDYDSLDSLKTLLVDNGWTPVTAVCTMIFSLMHWPCSTTCLTIKKESQSIKWTVLSVLIPTFIGMLLCFVISGSARLFGFC